MQVRRPDGGIVPSTASRRFTSDARVSSSKPLAHPGWGRGYFPTKRPSRAARLPGEFVTAHVRVHRLGTRMATQATAGAKSMLCTTHTLPSSPSSVNLVGFLQPHPRVSQFVADPHPLHPGPINAGRADRRPELRLDGCPPPLDRERDLACFKTSRHSFIFQTGCFTQMDLE